MFTLDVTDRRFLRVNAKGVLNEADYSAFEIGFNEHLARRPNPFPLLLDLRGFRGWTVRGFIRDLLFDVRHRRTFSRIAVLGDHRWHRWSTWAAAPLFTATLRFFRGDEEALATDWLSDRS